MKRFSQLSGGVLVSVLLSGCGNGSDSRAVETPPVQPPTTVEFTSFVTAQFEQTSDTSDSVSVDELQFDFSNAEDPQAFDALL